MFQEMELFSPPQESFFYLMKRKPPKNFLYFLERKLFFCFSKKFFMFQEVNFRSRKKSTLKKLLIFQEMEPFNPQLKKSSYLLGRNFETPSFIKVLIFFSFSFKENIILLLVLLKTSLYIYFFHLIFFIRIIRIIRVIRINLYVISN